MEYFKNCYVIRHYDIKEDAKELYVCHFEEINYWVIKEYSNRKFYFPVLKTGEKLRGIAEEHGNEIMDKYLAYKNK